MPSRRESVRTLTAALLLSLVAPGIAGSAASASTVHLLPAVDGSVPADDWDWPLVGTRVERAFAAPAHRYGSGHRGIDLHAEVGRDVRAPSAGAVAFSGPVAGRGILTIDHGDGLVTTFEPIDSVLSPGAAVARGDVLGTVARGGHTSPGALHFGVRVHGEYINPLLLLGDVPRAVLLPCC